MQTSIHGRLAIGTAALAAVLAMVVGQAARGDEPLPPTYAGLGATAVQLREFVIPRGWPTPSCHASTIVETAPGELVAAYVDDIYLITALENARLAYDLTAEVLKQLRGIEVNQGN